MIALILEATVRSMALVVVIWLILKCIRLSDLRIERLIWTLVALVSLAMPVLLRSVALPLPSQTYPLWVAGRIETLAASHSPVFSIARTSGAIYCLIATLLVARLCRGMWVAHRICRAAHKIFIDWAPRADVRVSANIRTPSSFGSIILLPTAWESWKVSTLQAVIAHERAHIRNFDHYRHWLVSLNCALYWFNPAAIWLHRRLNLLAELISDETAIAAVGDRAGYAALLIRLAGDTQLPAATLAMSTSSTLEPRLHRLLENHMPSRNMHRSSKIALLSLVAAVAVSTAFADGAPLVLSESQDALVSWVSGDSLTKFYPDPLRTQRIEGTVECRLTINAAGDVIDAMALTETPTDSGLALAAVEAAKTFHFTNTLSRPVVKVVAVKFGLSGT